MDQMLPVHNQIDTRISAHQFFIGVWAQHPFAELYHHATELPDDAAVCDLRGKVVVACVDQYDAVGIEHEVALEQIVTFVQPT